MPASDVFNATCKRVLCGSHTHPCTPQSGEQKPQRQQSKLGRSTPFHIWQLADGGGVLNIGGCSGEDGYDGYMLRRLHFAWHGGY